jgi:hypothetical protein
MAFKQEHPGIWYDRDAQGAQVFKVAFSPNSDFAKALNADGVRTNLPRRSAQAIIDASKVPPATCQHVQGNGAVCARSLPCGYHSR